MKATTRLVLLGLALAGLLLVGPREARAASSTSFSPTLVTLGPGGSATIRISTQGVLYNPSGATTVFSSFWLNLPAGYTLSNVACTGIFSGADPFTDGTELVACDFPWSGPGVSGSSGDVLTFTITRGVGALDGTVTFDSEWSGFGHNDESSEDLGATNSVVLTSSAAEVPTAGLPALAAFAGLLLATGLTLLRTRA